MKHEWKKQEKEQYGVKEAPQVLQLPKQNFLMIDGAGDPNGEDFAARVGVLYSLAYPIKMCFKKLCAREPADFPCTDYTVYPLEGIWSTSTPGAPLVKDHLLYTIMIRQPDFITREMFDNTLKGTQKKKPHPLLEEVRFDSMEEGLSLQILHKGSYDDEPASFAKLAQYAAENGYIRTSPCHREIYLSDARKIVPEKQQTILRYQIKRENA